RRSTHRRRRPAPTQSTPPAHSPASAKPVSSCSLSNRKRGRCAGVTTNAAMTRRAWRSPRRRRSRLAKTVKRLGGSGRRGPSRPGTTIVGLNGGRANAGHGRLDAQRQPTAEESPVQIGSRAKTAEEARGGFVSGGLRPGEYVQGNNDR